MNTGGFTGNSLYGNGFGGGTACCLPGLFFLYLATQSNDVYTISADLGTNLIASHNGSISGLTNFQLVANTPEPSTIALFGTGILLMTFIARKKPNHRVNRI